jgi:WXG100 family type VII secretion target
MLLFFAYALFSQAMARLGQQIAKIAEIMNNAKSMADGLKDKWTGDDADAFQNVIASDVMPNMNSVINTVTDFQGRLNRAADRIRQADKQAQGMVGQLADVFSKIAAS